MHFQTTWGNAPWHASTQPLKPFYYPRRQIVPPLTVREQKHLVHRKLIHLSTHQMKQLSI